MKGSTELGARANAIPHDARIRATIEAFTAASARLVSRLERASDDAAARTPEEGGWTAAQIGCHVAAANEYFAGLLTGEVRGAVPAAPGFVEREWRVVAAAAPARRMAPDWLQPPVGATRSEAVVRLRASSARLCGALAALPPDRGAGLSVVDPVLGTLSLYQVGEWATGHLVRHNAQAKRVLGE